MRKLLTLIAVAVALAIPASSSAHYTTDYFAGYTCSKWNVGSSIHGYYYGGSEYVAFCSRTYTHPWATDHYNWSIYWL